MTTTFLPMDADPSMLLPKYTAQQFRQAQSALYGGGSGRRLGARSGFRVDTPSTILTATATTWTLGPCVAVIDPGAATHQGAYLWATDTNITGTGPTGVVAADATNARKDIVYIQINDKNLDGSGELSADVKYLAGTPSTTPAAPTLPARSFLVGTISVPVAGGGSPTVVLNPARFVTAGAAQPVSSPAERDALTGYDGLEVERRDDRGFRERHDGTGWKWRPEPRGIVWYEFGVVNSDPINTSEVVTKTTGTFTFRGGRRYRLGWQAEYYTDVTGLSFQIKVSTAAAGDAAGATTGLTPVVYHTLQSTATAAATQFFNMQGIFEPSADTTVQLKFSVVKVSGGGGSLLLVGNTGRRIEYVIEDMGAA